MKTYTAVAQRAGKLTAVLRNPDDPQRMARKAMDIRQLLELPSAAPAPGPLPQVIVGGLGRIPVYPAEREEAPAQPAFDEPSPVVTGGAASVPGPRPGLPLAPSTAPDSLMKAERAGRVTSFVDGETGEARRAR